MDAEITATNKVIYRNLPLTYALDYCDMNVDNIYKVYILNVVWWFKQAESYFQSMSSKLVGVTLI